MNQQHTAGHACRRGHSLLRIEQNVGAFIWLGVRHFPRKPGLDFDLHQGVIAVDLRRGLDLAIDIAVAVGASQVIPHHFQAVLGNRERVVARLLEVLQRIAVIGRFGGHRAFFHRVVHRLRCRGGALGLVHRNLVAVRVALEHRQLPGGELVLVLRDVGGRDHELWFFAFERVAEKVILHRRGTGFKATGPGGNGAAGIAGLFTTKGRQRGAQLRRFLRGNGGHHAGGNQGQGQCAGFDQSAGFHFYFLRLMDVRSSRRS
ncbi:hypothetical protein D3C85_947310 [compost metagenome]